MTHKFQVLMKNVKNLEQMQQTATMFILHDSTSNYKERLICLELFPLTMWLEFQSILFYGKAFGHLPTISIHMIKCIYPSKYPPLDP